MAINKKLIHFKKHSDFIGSKGINGTTSPTNGYYNNISANSIVFILDTKQIWTHGQYYNCPYTQDEITALLNNKADISELNNYLTTKAAESLATKAELTEGINAKYTKPNTGIPKDHLASDVKTSLEKADTALQVETDPVFSASAAARIKASDISNWNSKTSNTGTVTGIKMNGSTKNPSNGIVDLGTVITSHQDISGKAPIASPTFTGIPKAPTAAKGTNTTQVATTAFVQEALPTTLKNPNVLTIGSQTYDGSSKVTITAADLGLSSALKYHGTTTTALTDGATTKPIVIGGSNHNQEQGCVVAYNNSSFVWDGSKWEELGNPGNYKVVQTAVSSPSASGSTTAFIDTISQDAQGKITATKKNVLTASTSVYGVTKLSSATNSASEDIAATPKAVKTAYDLASSKWTYNADTIKAIKVNKAGTADIANSVNWTNVNNKPTNLSQFNDDVVAGKYLPLSGGTITGTIHTPLAINTTATSEVGLRFDMSGAVKGWVGYTPNIGIYLFSYGTSGVTHKLGITDSGIGIIDNHALYHTGNLTKLSQLTNDSGFITSSASITGNAATAGSLVYNSSLGVNDSVSNGTISYARLDREEVGVLPSSSNANGVLTLNTHRGDYHHQLGFTGAGLFYRNANGVPLSDSIAWKQIAFTDSDITGNAASATKLQTARTIFGQSFDGTGNVEGDSKANSFIATSSNGLRLAYGNYGTLLRNDGSGFFILLTNSGGALDGSFNTLRPFKIDLATGDIQMESNVFITKSFKLSKRLRVDARESATSFGYLKSNIASQTNVGIAHLGTNYGGASDMTREDFDMTAISMYRGIVGIGKEYDYTSLRAIYDAGVDLGLTKGLLIGSAKVLYVNNELNISTSAYINGNVKVENGNFIGNLTGTASNAAAVNGTKIAIVSLMPSSPDSSTLYFVK